MIVTGLVTSRVNKHIHNLVPRLSLLSTSRETEERESGNEVGTYNKCDANLEPRISRLGQRLGRREDFWGNGVGNGINSIFFPDPTAGKTLGRD